MKCEKHAHMMSFCWFFLFFFSLCVCVCGYKSQICIFFIFCFCFGELWEIGLTFFEIEDLKDDELKGLGDEEISALQCEHTEKETQAIVKKQIDDKIYKVIGNVFYVLTNNQYIHYKDMEKNMIHVANDLKNNLLAQIDQVYTIFSFFFILFLFHFLFFFHFVSFLLVFFFGCYCDMPN